MESWDLTEAERFVHAETGVVVGGDAGDEGMVASGAAFIDQPTHQKVTDSFMAGFGSEINSGRKCLWICLPLFPEVGVAIFENQKKLSTFAKYIKKSEK